MNRIEEIDLLKGVGILLMVMGHALSFGFNVSEIDTYPASALFIRNLIYSFHMPLFFFLSGYVIDLKGCEWDCKFAISTLKKKVISLILPAISYAIIFSLINGSFIYEWFLPALFLNTLLFILIRILFFYLRYKGGWIKETIIVTIVWLVLYLIIPRSFEQLKWDLKFFVFFYMGYIFQRNRVLGYLKSHNGNLVYSISVVVFVVAFYFGIYKDVNLKLGAFTGIAGVLMSFYLAQFHHIIPSTAKSFLLWMGRNTIVIYLLHTLFIPNSNAIGEFTIHLLDYNSFAISLIFQLLYGVLISIFAICVSSILGWMICKSKLFGLIMFGKRS